MGNAAGRVLPSILLVAMVASLAVGALGCSKAGIKLGGGDPTDRLVITSAAALNDCDGSGSRPVVVRIYVLAGAERFQDLDLEALWYGEPSPLGQDLLGAAKEVTVVPAALEPAVILLPREKGATAIGLVANLCETASGCWKKTIPLGKGDTRASVRLERTCMTVTVAD